MVVEAKVLAQDSVVSFEGDAEQVLCGAKGRGGRNQLQFSSKGQLSIGEVFNFSSSSHPSPAF